MIWLGVAVAGVLGSTLRLLFFATGRKWTGHDSPWTALALNSSGCFFLGIIIGLLLEQGLSPDAAAILGTGVIGSYTVVAPITYGALTIGLRGSWAKAALHSLGALLVCIGTAAIGLAVVGAL